MRVLLYTNPISHYCVSVERMLAYKGVRYDRVYAPYDGREALLAATGQDYIPALVWDRQPVTWAEIPAFLDRQRPEPALVPSDRAGVARALEDWGHQVLEERVWRAVVTQVPAKFRVAKERWVFEEMQTRSRGPFHVLKARRPEFVRELMPYFALVDEMVADRPWVLDRPSVADFGIYGGLSPWLTVGERIPPKFRHLARWVERVRRLEAPARPRVRA